MWAVVFFCLLFALVGAVTWAVISTVMGLAAKRTPGFSVMVSDVVGGLDRSIPSEAR